MCQTGCFVVHEHDLLKEFLMSYNEAKMTRIPILQTREQRVREVN